MDGQREAQSLLQKNSMDRVHSTPMPPIDGMITSPHRKRVGFSILALGRREDSLQGLPH